MCLRVLVSFRLGTLDVIISIEWLKLHTWNKISGIFIWDPIRGQVCVYEESCALNQQLPHVRPRVVTVVNVPRFTSLERASSPAELCGLRGDHSARKDRPQDLDEYGTIGRGSSFSYGRDLFLLIKVILFMSVMRFNFPF